ncbi:histidine phosphatase family protein [Alteromonadaceae bacterium M269]|nr:histidine phosphatase family protein [Alteromonadaceae bacterium M269]
MSEVYLVRHGQASFGAANYDQLSDLGYKQAVWLGEYFKEIGVQFNAVMQGDMKRHQQTAQGICEGLGLDLPVDVQPGLNEFDFEKISQSYLKIHPHDKPEKDAPRSDFYRLLKKAMFAWMNDELPHQELSESWEMFEQRVRDVQKRLQQQPKGSNTLIVSSGGAISMFVALAMSMPKEQVVHLNMQTKNAGFSRFFVGRDAYHLSSFNNAPHLETTQRKSSVTYS